MRVAHSTFRLTCTRRIADPGHASGAYLHLCAERIPPAMRLVHAFTHAINAWQSSCNFCMAKPSALACRVDGLGKPCNSRLAFCDAVSWQTQNENWNL